MNNKLRLAADAATVAIAAVVIAVAADRYFGQRPLTTDQLAANPLATALLNAEIDPMSVGVDFRVAKRTAIVFVQQECPACIESLPFYRRLTNRDTDSVQIVFAAPRHNTDIESYLSSNNIIPDRVILVGPGQLPATATPTVMLVDEIGSVTHSWVGWLSDEAEREVLDALFAA